jgi:hypothetical protein
MLTLFAACVAIVPRPRVVLAAAASASSISVLPKEVRVVTSAVPAPVKYGSLSAAQVRPASAANSASYA